MKQDYRTRESREEEVLAQIEIDDGLYLDWLEANRQRTPALNRLLGSGRVRYWGTSDRSSGRLFYRYSVIEEKPRKSWRELFGSMLTRAGLQ